MHTCSYRLPLSVNVTRVRVEVAGALANCVGCTYLLLHVVATNAVGSLWLYAFAHVLYLDIQ